MVQPCSTADRRVLSVGNQLPRRTRFTAQQFENLQVIGTGTDNPGRRPFDKGRDEGKSVFQGRWRIEHPGIGGDANESGQDERRPRRQSGEPTRVPGLFRNDVLEMRADQHIDAGKEHRVSRPHRPKRARSSSTSSDLGESRSTPGRRRTLRTVTRRNGVRSDGARRFSASSRTLEMNALTLRPWAAACRRTCLPRCSSRDMVVLVMQSIIGNHRCIEPESAPAAGVGLRSAASSRPGPARKSFCVSPTVRAVSMNP